MGDILDLIKKQEAVLKCALVRLEGFCDRCDELVRRDVDEGHRLNDLIRRRAEDLNARKGQR